MKGGFDERAPFGGPAVAGRLWKGSIRGVANGLDIETWILEGISNAG
jgi:hypothetical protein